TQLVLFLPYTQPPSSSFFPTRRSSDLTLSYMQLILPDFDPAGCRSLHRFALRVRRPYARRTSTMHCRRCTGRHAVFSWPTRLIRSEEHTSELQSRVDLVCRLLLEKKNP